jgi:hypothetical protein
MSLPCGPGAGSDRGLDMGWRWTLVSTPNMLARLGASPSLLSTCGWQVSLGMVTINGYAKLTVVLRLVNWARSSTESVVRAREGTRLAKITAHYSVCCLFVCCKQGV